MCKYALRCRVVFVHVTGLQVLFILPPDSSIYSCPIERAEGEKEIGMYVCAVCWGSRPVEWWPELPGWPFRSQK